MTFFKAFHALSSLLYYAFGQTRLLHESVPREKRPVSRVVLRKYSARPWKYGPLHDHHTFKATTVMFTHFVSTSRFVSHTGNAGALLGVYTVYR